MAQEASAYVLDIDLYDKIVNAVRRGLKASIAVIVDKVGSGPRDIGAKIAVFEDGSTVGTLGGGSFEAKVVSEAIKAINEGRPRVLKFSFTGERTEGAIDTGLMCGGVLTVFIDVISPQPRVFIVGAGRVGKPLADLLNYLKYRVIVIDLDRGAASRSSYPYAEEIVAGDLNIVTEAIKTKPFSNDAVLITHGELEVDYAALKAAIESKAGFIGLLGSRRKIAEFVKKLLSEGVSYESFSERLHAPVGLDIGADNPVEVAVSIIAELIAWFKGLRRNSYSALSIVKSLS
ncbi:MAG: XdhC family protein [Sulfolobales archaeon]|nr:XdhC family protein [Sulfolobales archaeon]MCX8198719.1 XdhC family protein [Sulfolobales archaeon]MDW8169792.1 XdhC family protein [Desulfurococcaceae archaeon]